MEAGLPHPAIVVAAWNRPRALQRLLDSLSRGHFPTGTQLHISIDHFGEWDNVLQLANGFQWPYGEKIVEQHPERLGLRRHLLYCGGLSAKYGAIILLEDDLAVSPWMYDYAVQALDYFTDDEAIAGISLYKYNVTESCLKPFEPLQDGLDNWFLQMPSSWGAAFTAAQWSGFTHWLATHFQRLPILPDYMQAWSDQSWKKLMAAYMLVTGKYFAYPHFSLSTNFEDFGAHANTRGLYQVPLLMGKREWNFGKLKGSGAVYDLHFELLADRMQRLCPALEDYDFAVDLYGQKSKALLDRPWVITSRKGGDAKLSFGASVIPHELNLQMQIPGDALRLVPSNAALAEPDPLEVEFNGYSGAAKSAALHLPARRMPAISIVAPCSFYNDDHDYVVDNLIAQRYPGKELVMVTDANCVSPAAYKAYEQGLARLVFSNGSLLECVQKGIEASSGELILILECGGWLEEGILLKLAKIFHQFPGLDWLSTIPLIHGAPIVPRSREIALYRWDTARFAEANETQMQAFLPAWAQVFRRSLWMKAQPGAKTIAEHMQRMAQIALPQVADLQSSQGPNLRRDGVDSCWGSGPVNHSRKYYHRHTPLLWKWHRNKSDYRPVLRFDADHDTWFEFDY